MDQPPPKPARRASMLFDAVLTLIVFVFFTWVLRGHVPSNDPFDIWFWGAVSSACLTAVFWLGLQMYHAVYRMQRDERNR
jgi:hypothetical protein